MPRQAKPPDMTKVGVQHPKAKPDCPLCAGRGWAILVRSAGEYPQFEGKRAVQRCDDCQVFKSDIEAAKRAHWVGVYARFKYPCVLLADLEPPVTLEYELWHEHPPVPYGDGVPFSVNPDRGYYFHEGGKAVALRWSLTTAERHNISVKAIRGLLRKSSELSDRLKQLKKRDKDAILVKWELGFLELLIATWGLWGEGEKKYLDWMREHRRPIAKKYGIFI